MSRDGQDEFTYVWRIENILYNCVTATPSFVSPPLVPGFMKDNTWTLKLSLDVFIEMSLKPYKLIRCFVCSLQREKSDHSRRKFILNFEIAFLASNGIALDSINFEGEENAEDKEMLAVKRSKVLKKKDIYFPQGVFTIRCRIWRRQMNSISITNEIVTERISAVTRICIEWASFIRKFQKFSDSASDVKKLRVHIRDTGQPVLFLSVKIKNESCMEDKMSIKMIIYEGTKIDKFLCKIFLLDKEGNKFPCGMIDAFCTRLPVHDLNVPLFFSKKQLINRKGEFLPNDELSLQFEFCLANRMSFQGILQTEYNIHLILRMRSTEKDCPDTSGVLSEDLISMYNNNILCDTELKTKMKTFHVHRFVLCARSPVFRSMLTIDMKESKEKCIEIYDLDTESVEALLYFLYTGHIQNIEWETATKLYYAADKYDIPSLKIICTLHLQRELSISNAVIIFSLADLHQNLKLKTSAIDFISQHSEEIFDSDAWESVSNLNPKLAIQVMLLKYNKSDCFLGNVHETAVLDEDFAWENKY
ncbi:UNVERIFIED_CONTAM: spop [Trichonephila clavipes]